MVRSPCETVLRRHLWSRTQILRYGIKLERNNQLVILIRVAPRRNALRPFFGMRSIVFNWYFGISNKEEQEWQK